MPKTRTSPVDVLRAAYRQIPTMSDADFGALIIRLSESITPATVDIIDTDPAWAQAVMATQEAAKQNPNIASVAARFAGLMDKAKRERAVRERALVLGGGARRVEGAAPDPDVMQHLRVTENQRGERRVLPTLANAILILTHDPRWRGRIEWDLHRESITIDGEGVQDVTETDVAFWISQTYGADVATRIVSEAIAKVSRAHSRHPVRDYLRSLTWDGTGRVHKMLTEYLGADRSDLNAVIGMRWMISAVARIMDPGCKVDTMIVLCGAQGSGKSTALSILGGEWYRDTAFEVGDKDAMILLRGAWIYEIAEIDGWSKREQSAIKAFLSKTYDEYRPPYGRHPIEQQRQVVFGGTTNVPDFLADPTGSRRYWPVVVGAVDLPALRRDRDQLWAEAVRLYDAGERWHLDEREAAMLSDASEDHRERDAWETLILRRAREIGTPTIMDIAKAALDIETGRVDGGTAKRIGNVLRGAGWEKRRESGGLREVRWHPPARGV